jgi:hypothetical protein
MPISHVTSSCKLENTLEKQSSFQECSRAFVNPLLLVGYRDGANICHIGMADARLLVAAWL